MWARSVPLLFYHDIDAVRIPHLEVHCRIFRADPLAIEQEPHTAQRDTLTLAEGAHQLHQLRLKHEPEVNLVAVLRHYLAMDCGRCVHFVVSEFAAKYLRPFVGERGQERRRILGLDARFSGAAEGRCALIDSVQGKVPVDTRALRSRHPDRAVGGRNIIAKHRASGCEAPERLNGRRAENDLDGVLRKVRQPRARVLVRRAGIRSAPPLVRRLRCRPPGRLGSSCRAACSRCWSVDASMAAAEISQQCSRRERAAGCGVHVVLLQAKAQHRRLDHEVWGQVQLRDSGAPSAAIAHAVQ
mmetsp:Transcript_8180/g.21394  ORF Transcript_8180/g.21394 Transcript_8180/m.21394 type:complete len:299 (+) Transcript_8180:387-1283(+)